jgi:hypothetical protein
MQWAHDVFLEACFEPGLKSSPEAPRRPAAGWGGRKGERGIAVPEELFRYFICLWQNGTPALGPHCVYRCDGRGATGGQTAIQATEIVYGLGIGLGLAGLQAAQPLSVVAK